MGHFLQSLYIQKGPTIIHKIVFLVTLDCSSLHWEKTFYIVYVSANIHQERVLVSLGFGRILLFIRPFYVKTFVAKERNKQTINASQNLFKIPSC